MLAELEKNDSFIDSAARYNCELEKSLEDYSNIQILVMDNKAMIKYAKRDYRGAEKLLKKT
jgi:hypothetical protein